MYRLVAMLKTATTDERNEVIAAIETMPDGVIAEFAHIATVEDVGYTLPDEDTDRLRSTVIASVEANINKPDYWKTNGAVVTQVFRLHAGITSNEATAELLAGILENDDDLCLRLIRLYAGVNVNTGEAVFLVGVGPPTPPWIPIEPLIAAVRRSHPDLGDVTAHDARFAEDSERRFAASFLVAAGAGSTAVE